MDEQKKQGVVAAHSGIVVGQKPRRFILHAKLWGLIAGCVVIIAVISGVVWHVHGTKNNKQTSQTTQPTQSVAYRATGLSLTGKYDAAQKLLDESITKTTDKKEQGKLYEQKANLAFENGDTADSLKYAQKAESLNPTANSANWIAQSAEKAGNTKLALQYYKLELQRLGRPIVPTANDELKAKIESLGG